jgi:hypothetical protein
VSGVRSAARMLVELARYSVRGALWWLPLTLVVISAAALIAIGVQLTAPVVVYVLF